MAGGADGVANGGKVSVARDGIAGMGEFRNGVKLSGSLMGTVKFPLQVLLGNQEITQSAAEWIP
jgi:hypothetical protein